MFISIFETERKIEDKRQDLNSFVGVELKEKFESIDFDENGEIDSEDIRIALLRAGIMSTEKDRKLLIQRYTKYSESISFEDFCKEVSPIIPEESI